MDLEWYAILGVRPNAAPEVVKSAYTKLIMIHHPDHGGGDAQFILIKDAYRRYINAPTPPQSAAPVKHHKPSRLSYVIAAGLVVTLLGLNIFHSVKKPAPARLASSSVCPTGTPQVTVTDVQILPDDELDPTSGLYMVSGEILNTTSSTLNVMAIGFYFGPPNPNSTPAWTDLTENMDLSGDVSRIPVGGTLKWREKEEVYSSPGTTDVMAALSYPESMDASTTFDWTWPLENPGCPDPSIFKSP